jgi:hypothetical protein
MAGCEDCKDTRRVPVEDCGDDELCFTGCWTCNENDTAEWQDDICPVCGGRFAYPVCLSRDCFRTAEAEVDRMLDAEEERNLRRMEER